MLSTSDLLEMERLITLVGYDIVGRPPVRSLERITSLVCRVFGTPMAAVSLSEHDKQVYTATVGMAPCRISREGTFCDMVAGQKAATVMIADTLLDERYAGSNFVIGGPKIRFYAGAPLRTPGGHSIGAICTMDTTPRHVEPDKLDTLSDLAEVVMDILELRRLATTDSLTGAMLRRGFVAAAEQTIALAHRYDHSLSMVSFDLDHFKKVNDHHGHAVGDLVLQECVAACRRMLRSSDILGRLGGEEFSVVLPLTAIEGGLKVAEKLRVAIESLRVPTPSGLLRTTASFGVATFDPSCSDLETLMRRADAALYSAKKGGRNRCVVISDDDALHRGADRSDVARLLSSQIDAPLAGLS